MNEEVKISTEKAFCIAINKDAKPAYRYPLEIVGLTFLVCDELEDPQLVYQVKQDKRLGGGILFIPASDVSAGFFKIIPESDIQFGFFLWVMKNWAGLKIKSTIEK